MNRRNAKVRMGTIFIVSFVLFILYVLYTGEQNAYNASHAVLGTPRATQPVTMP